MPPSGCACAWAWPPSAAVCESQCGTVCPMARGPVLAVALAVLPQPPWCSRWRWGRPCGIRARAPRRHSRTRLAPVPRGHEGMHMHTRAATLTRRPGTRQARLARARDAVWKAATAQRARLAGACVARLRALCVRQVAGGEWAWERTGTSSQRAVRCCLLRATCNTDTDRQGRRAQPRTSTAATATAHNKRPGPANQPPPSLPTGRWLGWLVWGFGGVRCQCVV